MQVSYSVVSIKRSGGNKQTGWADFFHLLHEKRVSLEEISLEETSSEELSLEEISRRNLSKKSLEEIS